MAVSPALVNGTPTVATSSRPPPAGGQPATADQTVAAHPERPYLVLALVLFVVGVAGGLIAQGHFHHNLHGLPVLNAGVSTFALTNLLAPT